MSTTELSVASGTQNPVPESGPSRYGGRAAVRFVGKYGTILVLVGMFVGFSAGRPSAFLTWANTSNILTQASLTAIVAGGLTFPLLVGEFDLSIGYNASLSCVLVAGLMSNQHLQAGVAIVLVILLGAVIGLVNGFVVTKVGVNALVGTLGTGTILVGIDYAYSGGLPITIPAGSSFGQIFDGTAWVIPYPIVFMFVILGVLWVILNRTALGQATQAVGGNIVAARLCGIRVDRVKTIAFIIGGVCAAMTGILLASQLQAGELGAGDGYLLNSFAACFLGAAVLRDGQFHIVGTFVGVLTVGVGFTGLVIFGAPTSYQYLFEGLLLVLAVGLSTSARRFAR